MELMCPVSLKQVNERVVRINAALAILTMGVFFLRPYKWIILALAIDFVIRGFFNPSYSFYSAVSRNVLRILKVKPLWVDAGPKIFAAKLGFLFCCIIAASHLLNFWILGLVAGVVFLLFAVLEAVFGFCMACQVYPFIYRIRNLK